MNSRSELLQRLSQTDHEVLIIGGGSNGAAGAAALTGHGVRTALVDRGDFAGATSQESSNLIWGGIKYLEFGDFRLVRRLCLSRNELLRACPQRVQEIRFFVVLERGSRYPPALAWLGAWLYWLFGSGYTRPPRRLSRRRIACEEPRVRLERCCGGFEYSDAFLPDLDARFVYQFIHTARERDGVTLNYVEVLGAERSGGGWRTRARDVVTGHEFIIRSRVLVNAAGPWVDACNRLSGQRTRHHHLYSKGIHLIVDRLSAQRRVLGFFADDGRLFFAIPLGNRTCIGTTDIPVTEPQAAVTAVDRQFVLSNLNKRLRLPQPLTEADIIAERCGVRPLAVSEPVMGARDWFHLSRRHVLECDPEAAHISIFGGKLTDCLDIGNELCRQIGALGIALTEPEHRWYGEPEAAMRSAFLEAARAAHLDEVAPAGAEPLSECWWRRYGNDAPALLAAVRRDPRAAEVILPGTSYRRCEIDQARDREQVVRLADFLRRRTELAQILRHDELRQAPGMAELCERLFGADAQRQFDAYFQLQHAVECESKAS
jgi:glycerol-3-phosphate dehydrogenase